MNDYVEVYDGDKKTDRRIGRYCTTNPGTIESSSNQMLIIFHSNAAVTRTGKGFYEIFLEIESGFFHLLVGSDST